MGCFFAPNFGMKFEEYLKLPSRLGKIPTNDSKPYLQCPTNQKGHSFVI